MTKGLSRLYVSVCCGHRNVETHAHAKCLHVLGNDLIKALLYSAASLNLATYSTDIYDDVSYDRGSSNKIICIALRTCVTRFLATMEPENEPSKSSTQPARSQGQVFELYSRMTARYKQ